MKLSETQIQDLFAFVRKHYVEHYDLQTELVDHLANGIESQWREHPERSYKDARLSEFRKFGVGGFEKIIRKRRSAMEKRYWKIILRFFIAYFRWPKVLLTLGLTVIFTVIFKLVPLAYRYDVVIGLFLVILASLLFLQFKNRANNELEMTKYEKKWMLKD